MSKEDTKLGIPGVILLVVFLCSISVLLYCIFDGSMQLISEKTEWLKLKPNVEVGKCYTYKSDIEASRNPFGIVENDMLVFQVTGIKDGYYKYRFPGRDTEHFKKVTWWNKEYYGEVPCPE